MKIADHVNSFIKLGLIINKFIQNPDSALIKKIRKNNPWFIPEFSLYSLQAITRFLQKENILSWLQPYNPYLARNKMIGITPAGNIPLAGFHDLMCVIMSGHLAAIKPSHQDRELMNFMIKNLFKINYRYRERIFLKRKIISPDAILASGSDNTARYFDYMYKGIPGIIRKNRTSVAILSGQENSQQLSGLADDIFLYFGLGCRNVSKIYLPHGYDLNLLTTPFNRYRWIFKHRKYRHNYLYQKALATLGPVPFWDGGFYLLMESGELVSPPGIIHFEFYQKAEDLLNRDLFNHEKIQAVISEIPDIKSRINLGHAQFPDLWDYPDGVDTMKFLLSL